MLIDKIRDPDFLEALGHSKNYLTGDIAVKAIAFLSIPIFTRLLTQADYGIFSVFTAYVLMATILLSLNCHTAVGRYYYEKKGDFGEFLSTTLILVGLIFLVSAPVYLFSSRRIPWLSNLPGNLTVYILLASFFAIFYSVYYQILVPQKKSREFSAINIVKGYGTFALSILLVWLIKEDRYLGRVYATLLAGLALSIYFIRGILKYTKASFNLKHLKYIAGYSIPLIPYQLSSVVLSQFDRIMVNDLINSASAGLYSLGYNIGILVLMVVDATQKAIMPDFYLFLDNNEHQRLDALIKKIFLVIVTAAMGIILFAPEVFTVLADKKFHPGFRVIPAVVIGYVFFAMAAVYNRYIFYKKKTFYFSLIVLIAGALNIALNAFFIPKYGYIAAGYTTAVSYFSMFILSWLVTKFALRFKVTPLAVLWKPTILMLGLIAVLGYLQTLGLNPALYFGLKLIVFTGFISLTWKQIR